MDGSLLIKREYPTGVELPLRGGGVAVLYEFTRNMWRGKMKITADDCWHAEKWWPDGTLFAQGLGRQCDLIPLATLNTNAFVSPENTDVTT